MSLAFALRGITQRFGPVTALDDVTLEVAQGEVHAVVGENGAGKTTLMRVLYGSLHPTAGEVEIEGRPVRLADSAEAIRRGVGMVSQHYAVIPELTNLQNLMLGAEGGFAVRAGAAKARADELAARMGFQFDWDAPSRTLSPAGAQKLEILKLLWRAARILILDEPTALLPPADAEALFASLKQLVAEGATVVLVTHRLPEVMRHCDRVTVLRAGRRVAQAPVAEVTPADLARWIVGEDLRRAERLPATPGETVLAAERLTVRGARGEEAVKGATFALRTGEVVGIAGVDGSGQRELVHALMGLRRASGSLTLGGDDASRWSAERRLAWGLRVIPEDRHGEAVIEDWSLELNGALGLQRTPELEAKGAVRMAARQRWAERVADRFATKRGRLADPMRSLSGGNQQRFVAARALESGPKTLIAFQPARGLDLGATGRIYDAITRTTREGAAALVVSFDLDEILDHCDRVLVMNRGTLTEAPVREREAIGRLMVGA